MASHTATLIDLFVHVPALWVGLLASIVSVTVLFRAVVAYMRDEEVVPEEVAPKLMLAGLSSAFFISMVLFLLQSARLPG